MGKVRRGNYVFLTWTGDHTPRHVHVYKDGKLVVKWDLEGWQAMKGRASARVLRLIRDHRLVDTVRMQVLQTDVRLRMAREEFLQILVHAVQPN